MSRTIPEQMQVDLVTALKAGDVNAVSVLRTTLAALANAEAVETWSPELAGYPRVVGSTGSAAALTAGRARFR